MDDQQFRRLLQYLHLSWAGYLRVRKGVKRRILRHMGELKCLSMERYLAELDRNTQARKECDRLMTVSVSRFFRDRKLWELLRKDILPALIRKHKKEVSVWSAGCASGEEVYSLKILWESIISSYARPPQLSITATDMNPDYLDRARSGVYPPGSLKDLPEEYRFLYFDQEAGTGQYAIKEYLKKGIRWQVHDLLNPGPESGFHIIFLRNNVLTYYLDDRAMQALGHVLAGLRPGGTLIIGSHERLPRELPELVPCGRLPYVFINTCQPPYGSKPKREYRKIES